MNNNEKLNHVVYYYLTKKFDVDETTEFFDLDFSKIFESYDKGVNELQNNLLKSFLWLGVQNINSLLNNMPE
mgnify:CR=1 FL=1